MDVCPNHKIHAYYLSHFNTGSPQSGGSKRSHSQSGLPPKKANFASGVESFNDRLS